MTTATVEQELEFRSGASYEVAAVDFPKRMVTVVAMPYESPAEIIYGGKVVTEVVSRGAFDGIERRAGQIRANRDHTWDKPVGKIVGLHPSRKEGLVTEIRIAKTLLGDDTLTLADDGILDASAGFRLLHGDDGRVAPGAEVWERNKTVRRLNKLFLDHVALVPNPAYPAAVTLDVRGGLGATLRNGGRDETAGVMPNRARLALDAQKAAKRALDERWLNQSV